MEIINIQLKRGIRPQGWEDNLAKNLEGAIKKYYVPFEEKLIIYNGDSYLSKRIFYNLLYGKTPFLSQDMYGRINFYNLAAEGVFGYTRDEAIGMPTSLLVPEDMKKEREYIFKEVVEKNKSTQLITYRLNKWKERINIWATVFPYEFCEERCIAAIVKKIR